METDALERLQRAARARPRRALFQHQLQEDEPVSVLQTGDTVWVTRRVVVNFGSAIGAKCFERELLNAKDWKWSHWS